MRPATAHLLGCLLGVLIVLAALAALAIAVSLSFQEKGDDEDALGSGGQAYGCPMLVG